jgi:uncharacterized protein (UPF0332 family)
MLHERLLKTKRIQPYSARHVEISKLIGVARRDISTAIKNLDDAPEWAYSIAYNALLQASRALMLSTGFRPRGGEQHATVVEFITEDLGSAYERQTALFDQMRRKRHRVIYETTGLISRSEAAQAVDFAREFVEVLVVKAAGQEKMDI